MTFEDYVRECLEDGKERMGRIESKQDEAAKEIADLRVNVERKSAMWGGITGIFTSVIGLVANHKLSQ
jgi:hypothetical protein